MGAKRHIVSGRPVMRRGWFESAPPKVLVTDRRPRVSAEPCAVTPAGEPVSVAEAIPRLAGAELAAYVRARRTAALSGKARRSMVRLASGRHI